MIQMIIDYLEKLKLKKNKYIKDLIRKEIEDIRYNEIPIKSANKKSKLNDNDFIILTYEELSTIILNLNKIPNVYINKNSEEISIGIEENNPYTMYSIYLTRDNVMRYTMSDGNHSLTSTIYCEDLFKKINEELKETIDKKNQDNFLKIKSNMYKKYNFNRYDNIKILQDFNKKNKENDNKGTNN